jgi:uncharacterized protein YecE (DUF72 family)
MELRIGTAAWAIPRAVAPAFPVEGPVLERYAAQFDATEINSSFYRPHRPDTWRRWRDSTPPGFRFAVKVPQTITHEARLAGCEAALDAFLDQARLLEDRLGPLLVQLPPSLAFDAVVAARFFTALRERHPGPAACEPRHASWFGTEAEALLNRFEIARVAADPSKHPGADVPGGWPDLAYWRLHGSPRIYYSTYEPPFLERLADTLRASAAAEVWCVFDNTALGQAAANALTLKALLASPP